jgi:hypothetical protein
MKHLNVYFLNKITQLNWYLSINLKIYNFIYILKIEFLINHYLLNNITNDRY